MSEEKLQRAVARVLDASGLLWCHVPAEAVIVCGSCRRSKPLSMFVKRKQRKRPSRCKECHASQELARRHGNPERARLIASEYRKANRDRVLALKRAHYERHKDKLKEKQRAWNKANPQASKKKAERWPEKAAASQAAKRLRIRGMHAHHWNYSRPMEVIYLNEVEHNLVHRHLVYDHASMKYNGHCSVEEHVTFLAGLIGRTPSYVKQ